jgi:hypothetical protein
MTDIVLLNIATPLFGKVVTPTPQEIISKIVCWQLTCICGDIMEHELQLAARITREQENRTKGCVPHDAL